MDIGRGEQFAPQFLAISPNNRMPAIVDHDVDGDPVPVCESGAIAMYLVNKTGKLVPPGQGAWKETLECVFWQVGNLGSMADQLSHFVNYAEGEHPRYRNEYHRCLGVLERRLGGREYLLGPVVSHASRYVQVLNSGSKTCLKIMVDVLSTA